MEPLNKPERSKAIQKFAGFYALSLALPLLAFYFLFRSPTGSLASENQKLKLEKSEYDFLLTRLDSIARQGRHLQELDSRMATADAIQRANLALESKRYEALIQNLASEDRSPMTANLDALPKAQASNIGHGYEAILGYRLRADELLNQLSAKGGDDAMIGQLRNDIMMKEQTIIQLQGQLMMKEAVKGAGGGGGGGGGGGTPPPKPGGGGDAKEAQAQLDRCNQDKQALRAQFAHELQIGKALMLIQVIKDDIGDISKGERKTYKDLAWKVADDLLKAPGISDDIRKRANDIQTQIGAIK